MLPYHFSLRIRQHSSFDICSCHKIISRNERWWWHVCVVRACVYECHHGIAISSKTVGIHPYQRTIWLLLPLLTNGDICKPRLYQSIFDPDCCLNCWIGSLNDGHSHYKHSRQPHTDGDIHAHTQKRSKSKSINVSFFSSSFFTHYHKRKFDWLV